MNKFAKVFCTVMALGMACSVVGCGGGKSKNSGSGSGSGGDEPLTQEQAFTAVKEAVKDFSVDSAISADITMKSTSVEVDTDSDPAVTSTDIYQNSYKLTYNPETREGAMSYTGSETDTNQETGEPETDEYGGSMKVVKDGDFYYAYQISPAEDEEPASVHARKFSAANYAKNDMFETEYNIAELFGDLDIPWLNAPNAAAVLNGFNDMYKNDANKSFDVSFTEADDGAISLTVKYSGTLSKTMDEITYTSFGSKEVSVTIKDGKPTAASVKDTSSTKEGDVVVESDVDEYVYAFTYAFDTAMFDGVDLTGAPEKDTIQETTNSQKRVKYIYCIGDYTGGYEGDYDSAHYLNTNETTAEQVADFKAKFADVNDSYGEILGYYTDKAMTKELTDTISDADWEAVDMVYVKRATKAGFAYIQMSFVIDCNADWQWIMGDMTGMVRMSAYPVANSPYSHEMMALQYGTVGTVSVSVNGQVTEEMTMAVTEGTIYKVEYKVTITDAANILMMR